MQHKKVYRNLFGNWKTKIDWDKKNYVDWIRDVKKDMQKSPSVIMFQLNLPYFTCVYAIAKFVCNIWSHQNAFNRQPNSKHKWYYIIIIIKITLSACIRMEVLCVGFYLSFVHIESILVISKLEIFTIPLREFIDINEVDGGHINSCVWKERMERH